MKLISPAKINPFLRILKKREDGYHELASLFQAVNLVDILTFLPSSADLFTCNDSNLPLNHNNLVVKALTLFRKKTGFSSSFHINLEKQIPIEAGLGGGSSNAATVLYALNRLAKTPCSNEELSQMGAELGSDVPFFFSSGTAYCTGRGEKIQDVSLEKSSYTICKPSFGSSTPAVYKALLLDLCSKMDPRDILTSFISGNPYHINDLETAAFSINPALKIFKKELLNSGYKTALLSGSGSSFICKGNGALSCPFAYPVSTIQRKSNSWY